MTAPPPTTVCYLSGSSGDWGGASRVLYTNLEYLDRERFRPIVLLPSEGPIQPRLERLGIRYVIWGDEHEPHGKLAYARDVLRSLRFFRDNGVDVLHMNHCGYWRPAEILAARLARIPVVTHYHRTVNDPGPFVRYSRLIVAVSEFTARNSLPKSVQKIVVHNAVNLERFDTAEDMRASLGIAPGEVTVSFIGQVREIKGIDLFIRMAHAIRGDDVRFLIAGACRDPQKFEGAYTEARLREEIGGDARIRYVGYMPDVHGLYLASDIIVMPSRWGEPFGLVNIEAGAARRPIVSTRDGGIPEIIRHGQNGFLVERDDLAGLIEHVELLISDRDLRLRLGEQARRIVETEFTDRPVRRLEDAYARLQRRGPGQPAD
jgi:glycosyltransferase involved in cell wall biosynthesis